MTTTIELVAANADIQYEDAKEIEWLIDLFKTHNLTPESSKNHNAYPRALAMLVHILHAKETKAHVFESLPYTGGVKAAREIDVLDILNTIVNLGFSSHDVQVDLKDIDQRLMPCLFVPDDKPSSPIVLMSWQGDKLKAYIPKKNKIVDFIPNSVNGRLYFFERLDQERLEENLKTKKGAGLTWFDVIFSRFKPVMRQIIITGLFINIFALAMPIFTMTVYDKVIGSGSTDSMVGILFGISIAVLAESFLRYIRVKSIVWLGVRLDNIVSNKIFEKLLFMKAAYTEGASISAQISRIKSFESVRKFFSGPLFLVMMELPFTLILLAAIWVIAGPLVFIPIIVLLLFVLLMLFYRSRIRVSMNAAGMASSYRQQHGMETFIKMNSLHHNGMARNWWNIYREKLSNASIASFESNFVSSVIEAFAHAVSIIAGVAVVAFGVHLIWQNSITIGALVATMILIWRILGPMQTMCSMLPRLEQLANSINQVNRLVGVEAEIEPHLLKKPVEKLTGNVSFTNVGLRYSTEVEPVFVGLDMDIKPGEIVAITGANGSGKSSLLKLINGLYRPQTGTINIDGVNIRQLEPIQLRSYIAYLPQIPSFFEGTIKENLLLVNPFASDEDLKEALIDAAAYETVKSLESGLDTIMYAANPSLPTGFVYNLNLARVFLKRESNLIMLDELPNSSLNEDAGVAYKKLIINAREKKKTLFFISQRDDYIKLADKVIVLHYGNRPVVMKSDEFINKYGKY